MWRHRGTSCICVDSRDELLQHCKSRVAGVAVPRKGRGTAASFREVVKEPTGEAWVTIPKRGHLTILPVTRALAAFWALTIALASPTPASVTRTTIVLFSPWSSSGLRHGFTVLAEVKGACWIHSLASERPDAWRCMAGDDIYDPCFSGSSQRTLACAEGPFSKRVTLMALTKPLAEKVKLTGELWGLRLRGAPWGLRLVSGDTCVFAQGATDAVAGERLNYACARTGWIIGAPDRSTATWTARSVEWPKTHITLVRIATAVF